MESDSEYTIDCQFSSTIKSRQPPGVYRDVRRGYIAGPARCPPNSDCRCGLGANLLRHGRPLPRLSSQPQRAKPQHGQARPRTGSPVLAHPQHPQHPQPRRQAHRHLSRASGVGPQPVPHPLVANQTTLPQPPPPLRPRPAPADAGETGKHCWRIEWDSGGAEKGVFFGMDLELQIFLWFALGAACLLSGNTLRNKHQRLAEQGQITTGIVTSVIDDSWLKIFGDQGLYHHSIRFITTDKRWISKSYINLIDGFQSRHFEGDIVDIIYNPTDPEEFIIGSSANILGPTIFMLIGLIFIIYSAWSVLTIST